MRKASNFPWIVCSNTLAEDNAGIGGVVIMANANAALLVGDAVFIQDAGEVDKSITAADYDSQCGIVVSGKNNWETLAGPWIPDDSGLVGSSAADAGELVAVCILGICWGIAAAAITAPAELAPDGTTAGRLAVDATPTADEVIARAWSDAAGAASAVKVLVGFS